MNPYALELPSFDSESEFAALGADIAMLDREGYADAAKDAAYSLSVITKNLIHSHDPASIETVDSINWYFQQNDLDAAHDHLKDKVTRPLGGAILTWLANAPEEDVVTFSHFNTDRLRQHQHQLHLDQTRLQSDTVHRAESLVEQGVFPRSSIGLFLGAMSRYGQLRAIDSFESGGKQVDGYCTDDTIAISNLYFHKADFTFPTLHMKDTIFHEYLHGAGRDRGFFFGIHTKHHHLRILEEAFVTHATTLAMMQLDTPEEMRSPNLINPDERYADLGPYKVERQLFALALKNFGNNPIPFDFVADTYFSSPESDGGQRKRKELERRIGKFFGSVEAFYRVADTYETTLGRTDRQQFLQQTIQDISRRHDLARLAEEKMLNAPEPFTLIKKGNIVNI